MKAADTCISLRLFTISLNIKEINKYRSEHSIIMRRRNFIAHGALATSGFFIANSLPSFAKRALKSDKKADSLYDIFQTPEMHFRPFVRWWWNGDKIKKEELSRELRLLKSAGIGGVEINPIAFPAHTDDMGVSSVKWLSNEWTDLLKYTLLDAKSLGMTCDIITGTGWPFGGEFINEEDRAEVVVIGVVKMEGPLDTELSLFDLYKEADPQFSSPYSGRTMQMMAVKMIPDPLNKMDEAIDLSDQISSGTIKVSLPKGKFAIYALVKITGFIKVIQGAPGGMGPVLNHFNQKSVEKYLSHMSDTIQNRIGPLAPYVRSFFVDSLEIQGANWVSDLPDQFKKRRGYDLSPYLPFILQKIGSMGNTYDYDYTVKTSADIQEMIVRVRYDFELTKAELFHERFVRSFAEWCSRNNVKSRAQAYGRGYFPLEGSFDIDIPECETWMKYGIGEDISEEDFMKYPWHLGQGNTMINKFVSSAAHLKNKKLVSSEELTNTEMVFNESFELFKIAGDQSTISGVTQPVFHGFNYSPENAPFPGWITYGDYFNENNTMWPYMKYYTDYRARLSALLQQCTMFADIALLAPFPDMWGKYGAQNEPFPSIVYPEYQMLIWESVHQNGSGCDYVSEDVINHAAIKDGHLVYNERKYHTLILIQVKGITVDTAEQLYNFVKNGGRIFCIETFPEVSLGWNNYIENDKKVNEWVDKMKAIPDRFILIKKPDSNFNDWYKYIQETHAVKPYVQIQYTHRYISQMRYQARDTEIILFCNFSNSHDYTLNAVFSKDLIKDKQAWLWDATSGERFKLELNNGKLTMDIGPAESRLIVFDKTNTGKTWMPKKLTGTNCVFFETPWDVEFRHCNGTVEHTAMNNLSDLKDTPEHKHFAGTVIYRNKISIENPSAFQFLNLGKVHGISNITINGKDAGVQWYGHRVYAISEFLQKGINTVEISVVTVMLNYMESLLDNPVAQRWTARKDHEGKDHYQPLQSLGLLGPVSIY